MALVSDDVADPKTAPPMPSTRRRAVLAAGIGLILMAVLAAFAVPVVGDAEPTSAWFRLAVAALYVVVALDVLVAWALYELLRGVDAGLSGLAAVLRLVYAGVFLAGIGQLTGAVRVADEGDASSAALHVDAFNDVWDASLFLFGLHLLLVGWLAFRSGWVPRWLAILLAVAGFGYAFDSVAAVLSAGSAPQVSVVTFIGEFLLAVWLLVRGGATASLRPAPTGLGARRPPAGPTASGS